MLFLVLLLVLAALGLVVAALVTASSLWAWVSIGLSGLAGVLLLVDWRRRRNRGPEVVPSAASEAVDPQVTEPDSTAVLASADTENAGTRNTDTENTAQDAVQHSHTRSADAGSTAEPSSAEPDPAEPPSSGASATGASAPETSVSETPSTGPDTATSGAAARTEGRTDAVSGESFREHARNATESNDTGRRTATLVSSGELIGTEADPPEEGTDAADVAVVRESNAEVLVVDEYPRYHRAECAWLARRATIPLPAREARELGFTPCGLCGPDAALASTQRRRRVGRR